MEHVKVVRMEHTHQMLDHVLVYHAQLDHNPIPHSLTVIYAHLVTIPLVVKTVKHAHQVHIALNMEPLNVINVLVVMKKMLLLNSVFPVLQEALLETMELANPAPLIPSLLKMHHVLVMYVEQDMK